MQGCGSNYRYHRDSRDFLSELCVSDMASIWRLLIAQLVDILNESYRICKEWVPCIVSSYEALEFPYFNDPA